MRTGFTATFTTAHRMIVRVLSHTSNMGPFATASYPAGFTQRHILVINISQLAQRCTAGNIKLAYFTGR
jgi:hypothetical protein